MTRVEVVTTHVDGRRVRTVIRPAAEAGTYHEHQENPTMTSPVKRSRRSLEDALERAATRVETTEQAYHVAAAEVTRLRESAETMRRDVRTAEDGEQAAHDAAAASARRMHELAARAEGAERSVADILPELARLRAAAIDTADALDPADLHYAHPVIDRAVSAYTATRNAQGHTGAVTVQLRRAMVDAVTATLTEPPARPEGAEAVEALIAEYHAGGVLALTGKLNGAPLADFLAERGVRVTRAES